MDIYLLVKLLHILSATVLFGTGLGTAFHMLHAYWGNDNRAMSETASSVVLVDWVFTTPAVIVQFATGLWLTTQLGIRLDSVWFVAVISLFVLVGACWLPVVWIQIRVRDMVAKGAERDSYRTLMRFWIGLGVVAFLCVLALFFLMVTKIGVTLSR